ncbi:MAG: hypothetical protein E7299_11710 [Lachnospiraceae bacterium]|nr:hypothetical protein [Lachnospiraceae bacterium]
MKMRKNILWGVIFLLAAVALVVKKLGYLQGMGFWSILFSVFLLGTLINGIVTKSWGKILFSAAFFIIVNDQILHLESLTPWTVLIVACLGTIGLDILFPMKHKRIGKSYFKDSVAVHIWEQKDEQMITKEGEVIQQDVVFGSTVKYIKSKELRGINADCVFGELSIYLTEVELKNHRAKIRTDVVFGNVHVYVPAGWAVSTNMSTVCGKVSFSGTDASNGEDKVLICGDVVFGEMCIHYV